MKSMKNKWDHGGISKWIHSVYITSGCIVFCNISFGCISAFGCIKLDLIMRFELLKREDGRLMKVKTSKETDGV